MARKVADISFFKKHKVKLLTLLTAVCVIVSIFTVLYKTQTSLVEDWAGFVLMPVQKQANKVRNWVNDKIEYYTVTHDVFEENKFLKDKLGQIEMENNRLAKFEAENIRLTELLKTVNLYPKYPMEGADVIGRDPNDLYKTMLINKGKNNDIKANMIILNSGALMGRILEVGDTFSKVLPLVDDRSAVSVVTQRNNEIAILKGDYSLKSDTLCKMEYINKNIDFFEGDKVYTSADSDIFPPEIYIGTVKEIQFDSVKLTRYAIVELAVNFKSVEKVLIINKLFEKE